MISTKGNAMHSVRKPAIFMACGVAALLGLASTSWGQASFTASGQTQVFTLTPGATSGPAGTAGVRDGAVSRLKPGLITIATVKSSILITLAPQLHGPADIAIFDVAGKQIFRAGGFDGLIFRIDARKFASGIYHARVRVDGQNLSCRFAVTR